MANEVQVIQGGQLQPLKDFDKPRIDYVRRRVLSVRKDERGQNEPKIDDEEMQLIILEMRHRRMDPLLGHCYVAIRHGVPKVEAKIDHYRVIGMQSGLVEEIDGPYWCGPDGEWRQIWYAEDEERPWPAAAIYRIRRRGLATPVCGIVLMETFSHMKWEDREVAAKLGVCAERQAWRRAFPEFFGGLYGGEEMPEPDLEEERPRRRAAQKDRPQQQPQQPQQRPPRAERTHPAPGHPGKKESSALVALRHAQEGWNEHQLAAFAEHIRLALGIDDVLTAVTADAWKAAKLAKTFLAETKRAWQTTPEETAGALQQDQGGDERPSEGEEPPKGSSI